jgi:hypothetical protein
MTNTASFEPVMQYTDGNWQASLAVGACDIRRDDVQNQGSNQGNSSKANAFCFSSRNTVTKLKTNQLTHEITAGGIRVSSAPVGMGVSRWML